MIGLVSRFGRRCTRLAVFGPRRKGARHRFASKVISVIRVFGYWVLSVIGVIRVIRILRVIRVMRVIRVIRVIRVSTRRRLRVLSVYALSVYAFDVWHQCMRLMCGASSAHLIFGLGSGCLCA